MNRIGKIFEIGYLVVAMVFIYEAMSEWSIEGSKSYTLLIIAAIAVFMFFFRRKMRIKRENYHNQNKQ
ncbi:MAG: hypothetical protein L3J14_07670 [Flavobacteriaceae bacterium]|nr:hypothetical protein [Flavobacteriaceae bacterium]